MIIGVTGTLGAGKGTIVEHLVNKKGFAHFSVRAFLTEEIKRRMMPINRDSMVFVANDLRERNGSGWIAEQLFERAKQANKDCIIESLRTAGEVETLRKKGDFILLAVDADPRIRYGRVYKRGSETDNISYETFLENEKREMTSIDPNKQNLSKCISMADRIIMNNDTFEELYKKVDEVLDKIRPAEIYVRPSWDEYFMKMASLVAERSTCLRHHVGAVIVKGKQVLTTGYNGAAKGVKDCIEMGCLRNELGIPSGQRHEVCRAIHAEQNAIIQAGVHGINISGAAIYSTHTPCMICAKMIVNAGIKDVVSYQKYADAEARKFLEEAGVSLREVPKPKEIISFKD